MFISKCSIVTTHTNMYMNMYTRAHTHKKKTYSEYFIWNCFLGKSRTQSLLLFPNEETWTLRVNYSCEAMQPVQDRAGFEASSLILEIVLYLLPCFQFRYLFFELLKDCCLLHFFSFFHFSSSSSFVNFHTINSLLCSSNFWLVKSC